MFLIYADRGGGGEELSPITTVRPPNRAASGRFRTPATWAASKRVHKLYEERVMRLFDGALFGAG